jgi:hypothetical protein
LQIHAGWLGAPLGPARTILWPNPNPNAVTNPGFETNVTSGWTFAWFAPAVATISRDAATAAVGSASAKISVTTASAVEWYVHLTSIGQQTAQAYVTYSATFWAKANPARRIHVVAGNSGGHAYVDVDQTWRQYQVVLRPTTTMAVPLAFYVGLQTGDLWLDDVQFQRGASNVWRRDFQNGIVLVNPTELNMTVPLETQFRRILGTHAPTINTGALANSMTLPAFDALFLLRGAIDTTPPGRTSDLRVGP